MKFPTLPKSRSMRHRPNRSLAGTAPGPKGEAIESSAARPIQDLGAAEHDGDLGDRKQVAAEKGVLQTHHENVMHQVHRIGVCREVVENFYMIAAEPQAGG